MKKIDETVASKEPLLSNESWDEVSINLALLSNETSTTADIDNDRSIVVGGSTPVRIAEPFLFDRTRDADQRSLMSWSDSDDENSRMNTHEFISPTPVMPSLSSKKRVRFKRHLHHPASNRSSVESSNLIKRGTGSNNSCSAYHTCRNRSNIKLDPFVRTRCGCRHPHSTNPDRTGWRSCARLTLHSLLLLLSLFVCAFIFNLNQQLQQMQSQLSDALVFYKHDDINLHELRSAFVDLQSNCSDRFGTMSRLQRKFDSTTIVWNNLTRQVSVIKQNLASALVVHQFADLRKLVADLGSGLSSTNDRLNEIDQITKPVKAILTRLNLIEHRFEQIEQSLNETNFNEKIRKSHEIESLNKILDYLSKHYVQVINQQAVFEAQINATLGIVDYLQKHLIIDSTPSSFSSSISFSNHSTF